MCTGGYDVPKVPKFIDDFTGNKMHTALWNEAIELRGKDVAVIGNGASGVQLIPNIVGDVKSLTLYQRYFNVSFF